MNFSKKFEMLVLAKVFSTTQHCPKILWKWSSPQSLLDRYTLLNMVAVFITTCYKNGVTYIEGGLNLYAEYRGKVTFPHSMCIQRDTEENSWVQGDHS